MKKKKKKNKKMICPGCREKDCLFIRGIRIGNIALTYRECVYCDTIVH